MSKRRDTTWDGLLEPLIGVLEGDDLHRQRATLRSLLVNGPLRCPADVIGQFTAWDPVEVGVTTRELLRFLRDTVRLRDNDGRGLRPRMEIDNLTLSVALEHGRLVPAVENGLHRTSVRTFLFLQLWEVIRRVGVDTLRQCAAPDCQRLFVKTHRQAFCTERCQKRISKRALRAAARRRRTPPRRPADQDVPVYWGKAADWKRPHRKGQT